MSPQSLSTVSQPGMQVVRPQWVGQPRPVYTTAIASPVGQAAGEPINWWLIGIAMVASLGGIVAAVWILVS